MGTQRKLITHISIRGLFGLYDYEIPTNGLLSNAAILYGENGLGKSTLLRLVFHLLSAAPDRGHRTALENTEFQELSVSLDSKTQVLAKKTRKKSPVDGTSAQEILTLQIIDNGELVAEWEHLKNERLISDYVTYMEDGRLVLMDNLARRRKREKPGVRYGEKAFLELLTSVAPTLFILNADRRLESDTISDAAEEVELRRSLVHSEPKRGPEIVARSREIALTQALATTARWISRRSVMAANRGSINVRSVYEDVLQKIGSSSTEAPAPQEMERLRRLLQQIDERTKQHAKYDLGAHHPTQKFLHAVREGSHSAAIAARLLQPYASSLEERLKAIQPIYELVERFVTTINSMLSDKAVSFKLGDGFLVTNRLGKKLGPNQLSSGEQQLLLLFCYVLSARDLPSVFMIDEPELSLNVKWQRRLVQALLDITADASIQFVFASHSMELLAQHQRLVVRLGSGE
ncbi:MAG: ATP-binding protein [Myxococcaceae bacterium]|nr:ATP-binding protein [Myxococcaceae bacterium]